MNRSPLALARLGRRLREAGHTTSFFGYGVRTDRLDAIARRFVREVRDAVHGRAYAVIGHSLGNVIYRLAEHELGTLPHQVIMLAPPNQPSAVARLFSELPVWRALFPLVAGQAATHLVDPDFYAALPIPRAPTLIFAGDRGPRLRVPFDQSPNDGLVTVEETRLLGIPHEVVPAIHTFLMNDPRVVRRVLTLLNH